MNFFQETFVTGTHLFFFALMAIIVLGTVYFISYSFFKELIENNRKLEEMKNDDFSLEEKTRIEIIKSKRG